MARRVFFSYHFDQDVWRANQVRNSWVPKPDREAAGFFDAAEQEEVKRQSDAAIKRWIDSQLENTSVTAVLIGEETADREYVRYEIRKSFERGNGIVGIHIDSMKDRAGNYGRCGANPLDQFFVETGSKRIPLSDLFPTYDWRRDNGNENIGDWVEEVAEQAEQVPANWRQNLSHEEEIEVPDAGMAELAAKALLAGIAIGFVAKIISRLRSKGRKGTYKPRTHQHINRKRIKRGISQQSPLSQPRRAKDLLTPTAYAIIAIAIAVLLASGLYLVTRRSGGST